MIAVAGMPWSQRLVPVVLALIVAVVTVELIRRRKLREQYAILWLGASTLLWVFAIFPDIVWQLGGLLNVNYLTIVVLACFLFLVLISLHQAVVISHQAEDLRQIAERLALLQQEVREREKGRRDDGESPAEGGGRKA